MEPSFESTEPRPQVFVEDNEYYWDLVTFLVEDRLFRVPKYRFVDESDTFAAKYLSQSTSSEGDKEETKSAPTEHIKLDCSIDDFKAFLKVLYPREPETETKLSTPEYLSMLSLSTRWLFPTFRAIALRHLTPLLNTEISAIQSITLGREHQIDVWLLSGYRALVERSDVITVPDAEAIGWRNAVELWAVREWYQQRSHGSKSKSGAEAKKDSVALEERIRAVFAVEFGVICDARELYITSQEREEEEKRAIREREEEQARQVAAQEAQERETERKRKLAEDKAKAERSALILDTHNRKPSPVDARPSESKEPANRPLEPVYTMLGTNLVPRSSSSTRAFLPPPGPSPIANRPPLSARIASANKPTAQVKRLSSAIWD